MGPEVDDVAAALKKGDLKFRLEGYKLKGSWALIRTRGYGGERKPVGCSSSTVTSGPGRSTSRSSLHTASRAGGDFAEILSEGAPELWVRNPPAKGGDTGNFFERIIARALELRENDGQDGTPAGAGSARRTTAAKTAKSTKPSRAKTAKKKR